MHSTFVIFLYLVYLYFKHLKNIYLAEENYKNNQLKLEEAGKNLRQRLPKLFNESNYELGNHLKLKNKLTNELFNWFPEGVKDGYLR